MRHLELNKNHTIALIENGKRSRSLDINLVKLLKHYKVDETNLVYQSGSIIIK
jgi:hypothetical protein